MRGKEETGKGLGAKWEGAILTQELYDSEANNDKFIPVLFSSEDSAHVPVYVRGATHYVLDDDYDDLYRQLTDQPKHAKPVLGIRRSLPPLDRKEDFLPPVPESHASGQASKVGDIKADAEQSLKPSPTTDQPSKPTSDVKPDKPTEVRSRVRASWIFGSLVGFAALVLMVLLWSSSLVSVKPGPDPHQTTAPTPIAIYRVRVTVLNPQQSAVNDAEVTASVNGERKKVDGGWEFDIPSASKPEDGKVTIYASRSGASLYGHEDLVLDRDPNPAIKIQLREGEPPTREGAPRNPKIPGGAGSPVKPAPIAIYRVRVTVLDLEQALVEVYRSQGKYSEAEPLFKRALAIREKTLGPTNPDVASSLNNLAALYHDEGKYSEAEPLYKRALAIWEKALGSDHPDVAQSLENYAALLRKTNREKEAAEMETRAKAIRAKLEQTNRNN